MWCEMGRLGVNLVGWGELVSVDYWKAVEVELIN